MIDKFPFMKNIVNYPRRRDENKLWKESEEIQIVKNILVNQNDASLLHHCNDSTLSSLRYTIVKFIEDNNISYEQIYEPTYSVMFKLLYGINLNAVYSEKETKESEEQFIQSSRKQAYLAIMEGRWLELPSWLRRELFFRGDKIPTDPKDWKTWDLETILEELITGDKCFNLN